MMSLGGWMNKILIGWGIDPKFADMFDETIIALLMVGLIYARCCNTKNTDKFWISPGCLFIK